MNIRVLKNSILVLISTTLGKLIIFLIGIMAARWLSQEDFGIFATIRNSIVSLVAVITGSFAVVTTRNISSALNDSDERSLQIHIPHIVSSIYIIIVILALLIFKDDVLKLINVDLSLFNWLILLSILYLTFSIFSVFYNSILVAFEDYKLNTNINIFVSLLSLPISMFFTYKYEVLGVIIGLVVFYFLSSITKLFVIKKKYNYNFKNRDYGLKYLFLRIKDYLSNNLSLVFTAFLLNYSFWYSRIILLQQDEGLIKVAFYDSAFQILSLIMLITGSVTTVALSSMSKGKCSRERFISLKENLKITMIISSSIACLVYIFSKEIMLIYGTKYLQAHSVLKVMSIVSILFSIATLLNRYVIAINKNNHILYATVVSAAVYISVIYWYGLNNAVDLASFLVWYYFTSVVYYVILIFSNKRSDCEDKNF